MRSGTELSTSNIGSTFFYFVNFCYFINDYYKALFLKGKFKDKRNNLLNSLLRVKKKMILSIEKKKRKKKK